MSRKKIPQIYIMLNTTKKPRYIIKYMFIHVFVKNNVFFKECANPRGHGELVNKNTTGVKQT